MGRKSLADKFYTELEVENTRDYTWAVFYTFRGGKTNSNFWSNLKKLKDMIPEANLEQSSAFRTKDFKGALTAWELARHYGAEAVIYRVEELDPLDPDSMGPLSGYKLEPSQGWLVMKAVRSKLEKLPPSSEEYVALMKVLRRFYSLVVPDEGLLEEDDVLRLTGLFLSEKRLKEIKGAWVSGSERKAVLETMWQYVSSNKDDLDDYYIYLLPFSINEAIWPDGPIPYNRYLAT